MDLFATVLVPVALSIAAWFLYGSSSKSQVRPVRVEASKARRVRRGR